MVGQGTMARSSVLLSRNYARLDGNASGHGVLSPSANRTALEALAQEVSVEELI